MPFNKNNTSELGTKRELQKSFPIIDQTKDNEDTSKNFEQLLALAGAVTIIIIATPTIK